MKRRERVVLHVKLAGFDVVYALKHVIYRYKQLKIVVLTYVIKNA